MVPSPIDGMLGWGFNGAATSRPRRLGDALAAALNALALQWGRDLSAAETSASSQTTTFACSALQWGRDLSAAETVAEEGASEPVFDGFNGAATSRPRRPPARAVAATAAVSERFNGAATSRPRRLCSRALCSGAD